MFGLFFQVRDNSTGSYSLRAEELCHRFRRGHMIKIMENAADFYRSFFETRFHRIRPHCCSAGDFG